MSLDEVSNASISNLLRIGRREVGFGVDTAGAKLMLLLIVQDSEEVEGRAASENEKKWRVKKTWKHLDMQILIMQLLMYNK